MAGILFLWLRCRLATVGLIGPPAWEPPCAASAALKKKAKKTSFGREKTLGRTSLYFDGCKLSMPWGGPPQGHNHGTLKHIPMPVEAASKPADPRTAA